MHKYLILFFSVSLFLGACKSDSVPGGTIKPGDMAGILTEIHIIDGRLYNGVQNADTLYKYGMGNYLAVFEKYHTDSAEFKKSLNYYATEPEKISDIYDKVDARVKALSDSVNLISTKERKVTQKADSIKAVHVADSLKKAALKHPKAVDKADSIKKAAKKPSKVLSKADYLKKLKQKHPDALPKK